MSEPHHRSHDDQLHWAHWRDYLRSNTNPDKDLIFRVSVAPFAGWTRDEVIELAGLTSSDMDELETLAEVQGRPIRWLTSSPTPPTP